MKIRSLLHWPALSIAIALSIAGMAKASPLAVPATELETFLDFPPATLLAAGNGPAIEGSAVQRTFDVDVGDSLTFNYNFLTNESAPAGFDTVNDFAFVAISGEDVTVLADLFAGFTDSASAFPHETGYRTWTTVFTKAGMYTLKLGVVDTVDRTSDTALLIDSLTVGGQVLDNLGFEAGSLAEYAAIGDARVVGAGFGVVPTEGARQLLLTTVPEPATVTFAALTALCCFGARYRDRILRRL
jgi:hypothetical protein